MNKLLKILADTIFIIAIIVILCLMALVSMDEARSAELEYDGQAAQQEQIFKTITWQTINCMSSGAKNQVRMGERDTTKLSYWLAKTCGSQFSQFAINQLKVDRERVLRLLLAMAMEEISNVPGVTIKKGIYPFRASMPRLL